jgi:hypothetical protein
VGETGEISAKMSGAILFQVWAEMGEVGGG